MTVEEAPGRGQARVIGLISLAHGASHFYQLALPPLFPHLKEAFAVSYTELGTLMTVFYVSPASRRPAPASWWIASRRARCCCAGSRCFAPRSC